MRRKFYITLSVTLLLLVGTLILLGQQRIVYGRSRGLSAAKYLALPAPARALASVAKADLARDLWVAPDRIAVLSVDATNFPDTSLSVLEPGQRYLEAATPGYIARFSVDGETYVYHGSDDRVVRVPAETESHRTAQRLLRSSVLDLQAQLHVRLDEVVVQSIEPVEFPDGSLGAPLPNVPFSVGPTPGYEIRLQVKGIVYRYWAAGDRIVYVDSFVEPSRTVIVYLHKARHADPESWGDVYRVERSTPVTAEASSVLALEQLFAGPSEAEAARGYVSPFSEATREILRGIQVEGHTAYLDLADVRPLMPATTDRSAALDEIEATLRAALPIEWVVYSIEGDRLAFCQWMERCE